MSIAIVRLVFRRVLMLMKKSILFHISIDHFPNSISIDFIGMTDLNDRISDRRSKKSSPFTLVTTFFMISLYSSLLISCFLNAGFKASFAIVAISFCRFSRSFL